MDVNKKLYFSKKNLNLETWVLYNEVMNLYKSHSRYKMKFNKESGSDNNIIKQTKRKR